MRLHHIIIVSVFSLLHCYSAWTQEQPFDTSIVPSDVEGRTLEVPRGGLRQISFTVTYIRNGIDYLVVMWINERELNIGNNNLESEHLLSIVKRPCEDSNKPGERCLLLQVTVNGTNGQISKLDNIPLHFLVLHPVQRTELYMSEAITLRLVDIPPPTTTEEPATTSTKPATTTEMPEATTTNVDIVGSESARGQCDPIRVETIVPWVFVGILAALLLLTIVILILVICKHRNRQKPFSEELALGTNNVPPAQPSESSDKNSLSKGSSIDETEIPS